ncbi:chorismate mutase [Amycolatopsis silviterrae]|uniref:Chorismate mutase n=1 Tax=Amycolatopsis silviterrae TaxID=1656914 RepID=A0ABW5H3P1_9PSEU
MTDAGTPELTRLRGEIDRVNDAMLALLKERNELCEKVAEHKRDRGIPMMQQGRLDALQEKVREFARENGIDQAYLEQIFEVVTNEACWLEEQIMGPGEGRAALARRARRIDHVAIAVRNVDEAVARLERCYGYSVVQRQKVEGDFSGMTMVTMRAGGVTLVLCEGDSEKSNVRQYIDHYGPGVQHVAIEVRDQPGMVEELRERQADLLTGIISSPGIDQTFTRRDENTGMQFEFVTRTDNTGFNNVKELFTAMERENVY